MEVERPCIRTQFTECDIDDRFHVRELVIDHALGIRCRSRSSTGKRGNRRPQISSSKDHRSAVNVRQSVHIGGARFQDVNIVEHRVGDEVGCLREQLVKSFLRIVRCEVVLPSLDSSVSFWRTSCSKSETEVRDVVYSTRHFQTGRNPVLNCGEASIRAFKITKCDKRFWVRQD